MTPIEGFRFGDCSEKGPRETNQDTVLSIELPDGRWLLAVADGMGGLTQGELASQTGLGALYRSLSEGKGLSEAMREANRAVFRESRGQKMGTTLVAAILAGNGVEIANVGDSRAYQVDSLGLIRVTRDHTMAEEAVREGAFSPDEADASPWANALSRYLGAGEEVDVDTYGPFQIQQRGWILLCTDGLYKVLPTEEIESTLVDGTDPQEVVRTLVAKALERGTLDNVSAAALFRTGVSGLAPDFVPDSVPDSLLTPAGGPRPASPWKPGKLLASPHRRKMKKKGSRTLAITVPLIVIPLVVVAVLLLRWWLEGGGG